MRPASGCSSRRQSSPLAFPARPYIGVKLSPDGRLAATASLEAGRLMIRVLDLERGTEEAPKIEGMNWNPVWLPDGRLSFTSMRKGDFDVYVKDVAGTGAEQALLTGPDDTHRRRDPSNAWEHLLAGLIRPRVGRRHGNRLWSASVSASVRCL